MEWVKRKIVGNKSEEDLEDGLYKALLSIIRISVYLKWDEMGHSEHRCGLLETRVERGWTGRGHCPDPWEGCSSLHQGGSSEAKDVVGSCRSHILTQLLGMREREELRVIPRFWAWATEILGFNLLRWGML